MYRNFAIIFLVSIIFSAVMTKLFVVLLKRLNARQTILKYVIEHKDKNGTPTAGGAAFVITSVLIYLLSGYAGQISLVAAAVYFIYALVGFFDDFIKIKFARNDGLTPFQKIFFQSAVSLIAVFFALRYNLTAIYVPFTDRIWDAGFIIVPFGIFIFLSSANCVNLTDGLDGLAASVTSVVLLAAAALIFAETSLYSSNYLMAGEYTGLAALSVAVSGGLIGYLLFNTNKASLFMGDTGSMALGGLVASVYIFSGNALFIPIIGIMYVVSGISVIVQVIYFKRTKKRIFLMAPFHHHLQHRGYTEAKIVVWYTVITLVAALFSLVFFL